MRTLMLFIILSLLNLALVGCGAGSSTESSNSNSQGVLVRVDVSPKVLSVPPGVVVRFTATAIYSNNTSTDVSALVTWHTSNSSVLNSYNNSTDGEMYSAAPGNVTVTASLNSVEGSTTTTVTTATLSSIELSPLTTSVPKGLSESFFAIGHYSDGSTVDLTNTVTWSSSNSLVANISNSTGSRGRASTLSVGTVIITATLGGRSSNTAFTVTAATLASISITPAHTTIAMGTTEQLQAVGHYTDGTTQDVTASASWSSSDIALATVSNTLGSKGIVAGQMMGTVNITAVLNSISGSTSINITSAELVSIAISPLSPTIPSGLSQQLTAIGTYSDNSTQDVTSSAIWTSGNTSVALVDNSSGLQGNIHALTPGTSLITANVDGLTSSVTLTVTAAQLMSIDITPNISTVALGLDQNFIATGTYSDGSTQDLTTQVTWTSSDVTLVTISNASGQNGKAHMVAMGSVIISAVLNGVTGTTDAHVGPAELVSISISPGSATITEGDTQQFTATGTYTDGSTNDITTSVTWETDSMQTATIDSSGLLVALSSGTSNVIATANALTAQVAITISPL